MHTLAVAPSSSVKVRSWPPFIRQFQKANLNTGHSNL